MLMINEIDFDKAIEQFPTHCNNKNAINIKEWISNNISRSLRSSEDSTTETT